MIIAVTKFLFGDTIVQSVGNGRVENSIDWLQSEVEESDEIISRKCKETCRKEN